MKKARGSARHRRERSQCASVETQYAEAGVDELIIPDFNLGRTVADRPQ